VKVSKEVIDALALAWLAEAKRIRSRATCDCGCGQPISLRRIKPGHDAKLLSTYSARISEILKDEN
jgi:hypothetical protein